MTPGGINIGPIDAGRVWMVLHALSSFILTAYGSTHSNSAPILCQVYRKMKSYVCDEHFLLALKKIYNLDAKPMCAVHDFHVLSVRIGDNLVIIDDAVECSTDLDIISIRYTFHLKKYTLHLEVSFDGERRWTFYEDDRFFDERPLEELYK